MSEFNEQPQAVEVEEQAEITIQPEEQPKEDEVVLTKAEYNKLNRKAFAYEATKKQQITKEDDPEIVSRLSRIEQIEAKRQFGYDNQLSPEETDFVFRISNGKPSKDILNDTFVKAGLEGYRQSKRVVNNTPGSQNRGFLSSGKEFKEMTEAERKQAFEEDMRKKRGI